MKNQCDTPSSTRRRLKSFAQFICLCICAAILYLADYAYHQRHPDIDHGYSKGDQDKVSEHLDIQPAIPATRENKLLKAVVQVESGGDPTAVSAKGAKGLGQAMPKTAKAPGFGVKKMKDHSIKEQLRFAGDYLEAMMRKYGNAKLATAAYNAGPGKVDRVLARMPRETREYVKKVGEEYRRLYAMDDQ